MKRKTLILIVATLMALMVVAMVEGIAFTPKGDIDLQSRYGVLNVNQSMMPAECLLTNSWISAFNFVNSTCRTLNYTAIIGYTFPSLAGTGNAVLCVDEDGLIYRGNATACP